MSRRPVDMERQDSGNSSQNTDKVLENAASNAYWSPASNRNITQNSGAVGNTPSRVSSTARNSATFISPFGSSSQSTLGRGNAMTFLNMDSTPDNPAGQSSAIQRVLPIGTASARSNSSVLSEGPPFTTDMDGDLVQTRFVRFGGIPIDWIRQGRLEQALANSGLLETLVTWVVEHSESFFTCAILCHFDDVRDAVAAFDKFHVVLTTARPSFIDFDTFSVSNTNIDQTGPFSAFEGQVVFIATPKDVHAFSLQNVYVEVLSYARKFGEVRSFVYMESTQFEPPHFRAEFFSSVAGENAVRWSQGNPDIASSPNLSILIQQYRPAMQQRAVNGMNHMASVESGMHQINISNGHETRHNWDSATRQHSGAYGRRGRGRGNDGGDRPFQYLDHWRLSEDSLVHQIDMEAWREHQPQTVNLSKIEAGVDVRTTVMLRNIPNRVQFEDLKDFLDDTSYGHYDFSYLRIDFGNNQNVGYAFVNFVRPEFIINFVRKRVGRPWGIFSSNKRCEVSYAAIQGIDCLLAKFRNSVIMEEYSAFRPKLWYHVDSEDIPEGKAIADEAPFPGPDNEQKRRRSRDNASTVGLYPPRRGRSGHYGSHHRQGQYDRGTSFAIAEEQAEEAYRQQVQQSRRLIGPRYHNQQNYFVQPRVRQLAFPRRHIYPVHEEEDVRENGDNTEDSDDEGNGPHYNRWTHQR